MVVDDHDARHAHGALLEAARPRCPRRAPMDHRAAAVARHPADDRLAHAAAVGGDRRRVEARRRGRGRRPGARRRGLGEDRDRRAAAELGRVDHRLAHGGDQRLAARVSRSASPTATTSTGTPWARSTSSAASSSAAARRGRRPAARPESQARSSRSWRRASVATSAGSSARRWTSASVCRTESCRWAAISARSCGADARARSAASERTSRTIHGAKITASTTATATAASSVARGASARRSTAGRPGRRRRPRRAEPVLRERTLGEAGGAGGRLGRTSWSPRGAARLGAAGAPPSDWRQSSAAAGGEHERPDDRVGEPQARRPQRQQRAQHQQPAPARPRRPRARCSRRRSPARRRAGTAHQRAGRSRRHAARRRGRDEGHAHEQRVDAQVARDPRADAGDSPVLGSRRRSRAGRRGLHGHGRLMIPAPWRRTRTARARRPAGRPDRGQGERDEAAKRRSSTSRRSSSSTTPSAPSPARRRARDVRARASPRCPARRVAGATVVEATVAVPGRRGRS